MKLALVVEGQGDVAALPVLVRRLLHERLEVYDVTIVTKVFRVKRDLITAVEHLERAVTIQARRAGAGAVVLVVVDGDGDCPPKLAAALRGTSPPHVRTSIVIANREYEAWLIAAATSLRGKAGLARDAAPPPDPDAVRDPKRWLKERMKQGYRETVDQPALTAMMDLAAAESTSRSFRKLVKELSALTTARPA